MSKKETIATIRDLYSHWASIEQIVEKTWVNAQAIRYYIGWNSSSSVPPPFIRNDELRMKRIEDLKNKKWKSYDEILYLNYLKWDLSKDLFESSYKNNF